MRRLYLLASDRDSCQLMVDDLRAAGVPEAHLHVLAGASRDLRGLPLATVRQTTELARGMLLGVLLGGLAGMLAGILGQAWPPPGLQVSNLMVVVSAVAGAVFGGLVSALMKSHQHNRRLDRFHAGIDAGGLLLMVDVPKARINEIRSVIAGHHQGALFETAKSVY